MAQVAQTLHYTPEQMFELTPAQLAVCLANPEDLDREWRYRQMSDQARERARQMHLLYGTY